MKERLLMAGILSLAGCGNDYFRVDVLDLPRSTTVSYRWTPPPESTRGLPRHSIYVNHSANRFERSLSVGGRWEDDAFFAKAILAEDELGRKKFRAEHQWDF